MAKTTGYASLCFLLVLSVLAHYGMAIRTTDQVQTGSIHIFNAANNVPNDISIQNTILFYDGTSRTYPAEELAENISYQFQVSAGMTCVKTAYAMTNSLGQYRQFLPDWCTTGMPLVCTDCYWTVDSTGFSLAPSAEATPTFVAPWIGPH